MSKYCTCQTYRTEQQLLAHQLPAYIVPVARIPVFISVETATLEFSEERPHCSAPLICKMLLPNGAAVGASRLRDTARSTLSGRLASLWQQELARRDLGDSRIRQPRSL
jgi:hypothetical protein